MVREILVDWVTDAGASFRSVMYFDSDMAASDQRDAIGDFLTATNGTRSNHCVWSVENFGRVLDEATGAVTGAWSEPLNIVGTGTVESQAVPDATQIVIRWLTGVVINGRFLAGRQFMPGTALGAINAGNVGAGTLGVYNTAGQALADAGVGFSIWHHPVLGAGGSSQPVLSAQCWNEFGVLRRRRK